MAAETGGAASSVARISAEVRLQAVDWLVALQGDNVDDELRARWQRWHNADPDHAQAWACIEAFSDRLQGLPSPLAHATLGAVPAQAQAQARRRALKALGLVAGVGAGTWLAHQQTPWREWSADHRSGVGQRRLLTLDDGSRVHLNADSAVNICYSGAERRLQLVRGEILIQTAPDPLAASGAAARPFLVQTAQGSARALGTHFLVRQLDERSQVAVLGGAVELRTALGSALLRLDAGRQAGFSRSTIDPAQPVDDAVAAWVDGMIVAHAMPLADFLAALARYRPGRLRCAPAAAQLKVSGTYPLADTDLVLDMLHTTLPVAVYRYTRYWVTVELKKN